MPLDATPIPIELRGLRIALLVSGGIAAYKVVDLASALSQAGCQVRVAMTAAAMRFVGPPTFQGVTGKPVATGIRPTDGTPEPHVFLGDWAQLILVAPATANVIGRIADGRSDDIVTATLLAARCPVVIAPAMNDAMWAKPALQENLTKLLVTKQGENQPALLIEVRSFSQQRDDSVGTDEVEQLLHIVVGQALSVFPKGELNLQLGT